MNFEDEVSTVANWDFSYDLVVVGSGGAGFAAAMAAADSGWHP